MKRLILILLFALMQLSYSQWEACSNGLSELKVCSIKVIETNIFAGTWGAGVFLSSDEGVSWTAVNNGLTDLEIYCLAVSGTNIFAGTHLGGVFLTTNNGISWNAVNSGLKDSTYDCNNTLTSLLMSLTIFISDTNIFLGTSKGVFLSSNNGTSWKAVNTGLTLPISKVRTNIVYGNFETIKPGLNSPLIIYNFATHGTNIFASSVIGKVFLSTNNGESWTAANSGIPKSKVNCLAASDSFVYAGTQADGLFRSSDNGKSWASLNAGFPDNQVNTLTVFGTNIFAGTRTGICRSTDNGTNWTSFNSGLAHFWIESFVIKDSFLYATTWGGGIFKARLSAFDDIENEKLALLRAKEDQERLKNIILFSSLAGLLMLALFLIIVWRQRKKSVKLNKRLDLINSELTQVNASKDKFFSILSHDLRGPVSAFNNFTEVMCDSFENLKSDEIFTLLQKMNESSKQLYSLLNNLLHWSEIQIGAIKANPEFIDLSHIAKECIELNKTAAERKKINIESYQDLNFAAYADENMTKTVIRNLISNAIKFSYEGSEIKLIIKEDENNLIISVKDTGMGIVNEDKIKLFKLDSYHTTMGTKYEKGTGLGLILSKELVMLNGGEIWFESEPGKGTEFFFSLPKEKVDMA